MFFSPSKIQTKNRQPKIISRVAALFFLLTFGAFSPLSTLSAQAQQNPPAIDPDTVVFSVDGKEYTNRDLAIASIDFARELERVKPEERRDALINILIDMLLLAKEGEREKVDEDEEFKHRAAHLRARALRNFYINKKIQPLVTEELVQERYVELLARFEPETQIRARHILVKTEKEAKKIITELDGGKDFIALAKEKSTGPSGPNGGDLGFFGPSQMVAPFQEAASKLKKGQYSKTPVKTQFGWHVIRVEEKRKSEAPTYQQVLPDLQGQAMGVIFQAKVNALRNAAKIEIFNPVPVTTSTTDSATGTDGKKAE